MKVYFASAAVKLIKYQDIYLNLRENILQSGHILTRDWVPLAIRLFNKNLKFDRKNIYQDVRRAILSADVIVAEASIPSISLGHEITITLEDKKPVLYLINENIAGIDKYGNTFIDGCESELITKVKYTQESLPQILKDFFEKYQAGPTVRFTMNLTNDLDNFLKWVTEEKKTTKSEYIRKLIKSAMEKETGNELHS